MRSQLMDFIDYIKNKKHLSNISLEAYKKDIKDFTYFLMGKDYTDVCEEDILSYLETLSKEYSENSIYRKLVSLRGFYKFLYKQGVIDKLPTEGIEPIKPKVNLPETLEWEEVTRIIGQCGTDLKGERDRLLIELLSETGVLISDILSVRISELREENFKRLKYIKGNQIYFIELREDISNKIEKFVSEISIDKENLFEGVTRQNFAARFKGYAKKAKIEKKVYPNMLRNTLVKDYMSEGIETLKDNLNIDSIEEMSVYKTRNIEKIKDVYMRIAIGDD